MKYLKDGKMFSVPNAPVNSTEEFLQRLEDEFKIRECMGHYFYYCDMLDPVGMASCFTDAGRLCWAPGWDVFYGKEAILAHLKEIVGGSAAQAHLGANEQVYFRSKDDAMLYCYVYCWRRFLDDTPDYFCYGRYEVNLLRESDGEWRFESLQFAEAGEIGGDRLGEYFNRPWPPQPIPNK